MTETQNSSTITAASPGGRFSDRIVAACLVAAWAAQLGQRWVVSGIGTPDATVTHRRWIRTTALRADEVRSVTTRRDDLHIGDLVLLGPGWRAITVPVEVLDTDPAFAVAVRAFVAEPTTRAAQAATRVGAVGDRQGARVPTGTVGAR
jgi:hypothetical protein